MIPKWIVTAGMMAANMALTMTRRTEGPRLDDLKFSGGDFGAPLPNLFGLRRYPLQIFWAEDLREVKQTRKTKGGKFNDYTYFGTFALALAGHEIAGLRRLWADKHLVLDLSGAGPVSPFQFVAAGAGADKPLGGGGAGAGGFSLNDHISIYLGTETQDADPRMVATTEARFGAGSCPAYRGTAYAVIKDMPLEKFGNRIPQCEAEVAGAVSTNYPYETFTTDDPNIARLWGATFSPDYSRFMWGGGTHIEIWDVAARARMISADLPVAIAFQSALGLYSSGRFLAANSSHNAVIRFEADGSAATTIWTASGVSQSAGDMRVLRDAAGTEHWVSLTYSIQTTAVLDGTVLDLPALTGVTNARASDAFTDADGSIWLAGCKGTIGSTQAWFHRVISAPGATGPATVLVNGLTASGGSTTAVSAVHYAGGGLDQFVFSWANAVVYAAARSTGTLLHTNATLPLDSYNTDNQFAALVPGSSTIWLGLGNVKEVSLADLSVIRTATMANWVATAADAVIYDPTNHALITSPSSGTTITWRYLDRIGSPGVTLGAIAGNIAGRVGIAAHDFSALDQLVEGWSFTQGQAANVLEPLFDLFDAELRPHDFTLQGIKRSGVTSGAAITTAELAVTTGAPRYQVRLRQASELPLAVTVNFADLAADQQPNSVRSTRPLDATGARGEKSLDLTTLAIGADDARALADRKHRRDWNERKELTAALTARQLALEPGDCRSIELDGITSTWRCKRLTVSAGGVLAGEWVNDNASLALLDDAAGASFDGRDESTVVVPLLSRGFVLDIPLLSDLDESANPPVYLAAAAYAAGTWPGATFYGEIGGEYSDELASVASAAQTTWGYTQAALGDANPNLWDRLSSLNVVLQVGTLTGASEAALDADPALNLALIGAELVQFTTATLTAPNSYTLSGFKRGRKGTEWACAGHSTREVFVLLANAVAHDLALSSVGTNLSFKAVTAGRTEAGTFPIELAPFTGASKKPYAPCQLREVQDAATGDWVLTWVRRSRIGNAWTSGTTVPLGEVSELYAVEIMDGATVKRTFTGLSSPTVTWTAAMQTTDFGGAQSSVSWRVYQISDAVGRGFAAAA